MQTAPASATPSDLAHAIDVIGAAYSPHTAARVAHLLELDVPTRREEATRQAGERRADLELYADLVAERHHGHRPNVRQLLAEDELYTTLTLLTVA